MIKTLEQEFLEAFDIEPNKSEITDSRLLELICVLNNNYFIEGGYPIMLLGLNIGALKEHILRRCIHNKIYDYVYNAVRKIMGVE